MPPIFYLLTSFLLAITATSVQFLNSVAYFVLVATISPTDGSATFYSTMCGWNNEQCWSRLSFMNICS